MSASTSPFQIPAIRPGHAPRSAEVDAIWSLWDELEHSQWLPPAELQERQLSAARSLLEHAAAHVPYYARLFAKASIHPADIRSLDDFRRIPITTRQAFQDHAADIRATQLPPGTTIVGRCCSSGTTGIPLQVMQTNVVRRWWWSCQLRDLAWSHVDPREDLAVIRTPNTNSSAAWMRQFQQGLTLREWFGDQPGLMESGTCYALDIRQPPEFQLAWLRRVNPVYLQSYPRNLELLAELVQRSGAPLPRLQAIQSISETLFPAARQKIETAFGVPVKTIYSCSEAGYVASPCPAGHGLHVHAEHVLLEVLNAQGEPCRPGETGRVVLTAMHNFFNPFIRYEIQDEVTLGPGPCPCGRGLPWLTSVQGKVRPNFQLVNGNSRATCELVDDLYDVGGYRQHQVIQRSLTDVLVRVTPNAEWTTHHHAAMTRAVQNFLEYPVHVEIELLDRIPVGENGKVRDIICEVPDRRAKLRTISPSSNALPSEEPFPRPPTVLFAWELGNGLGHVQALLPLARALAERGCRGVFAVRNPEQVGELIRDQGFEVLAAPRFQPPTPVSRGFITTYGDLLGRHGFDQIELLEPMVQAWQRLVDDVRPDLIVCDHAPTACLTCYGVIPTIVVGNGFCVPPTTTTTFSKLLPANPPEYPPEQLLQVLQEVQQRRGRQAPETLPGLFRWADCFVTAVPDIDPYSDERTEPVVGPLERLPAPTFPPRDPSYFAYLDAGLPGIEHIVEGLIRSGVPGRAYLRNVTPEARQRWLSAGLNILTRPAPLREIASQVSVIVHHASGGTAQHALAAGRPQLLFPTQLEQVLTSQMLHAKGVGNYIIQVYESEVIARELQRLIVDPGFSDRAWGQACELQAHGVCNGLSPVLAQCLHRLHSSHTRSQA